MIFSSFEYLAFFIVVLLLMIFISSHRVKQSILLVASYWFYSVWDWRFTFLLFGLTLVNYWVGQKIKEKSNKKLWLTIGLVIDLAALAFFKYLNFFIDTANTLFGFSHLQLPLLNIILPIGISFIVFEVISYIVDIYRGETQTVNSFWDLALLVSFFPHLIAGPILKPSQFLPQLSNDIRIKPKNLEYGLQIFLLGMIKKVMIADNLAMFVDSVFKDPSLYNSYTVWLAVIAYAIQIFCDFSGYTDMAIGSAKCLGFEIPPNFNMPYISTSITEFWRRWHISLSTWLKEYLYISLGGNKKGKLRQYLNLLIVMFLGGLWHGASWNFVIWGCLHGFALCIHKFYSEKSTSLAPIKESAIYKLFSWLLTNVFVCFAWVFFRSGTFSEAMIIVKKLCFLETTPGVSWFATSALIIFPIIFIAHMLGAKNKGYFVFRLTSSVGLFLLFFVLLGLLFLMPTVSNPFIYFQF